MVKKVGYIVLIILTVLFIVGYLRYNPTVSFANTIPVSADAIVRVNLRKIEYTIIKDVVKHPLSYFKSTKKSPNTQRRISLLSQIVIPTDLFFYTDYDNLKETWVSSAIKIKKDNDLEAFFRQENFKKSNTEGAMYFFRKNFICFVNNEELRIMFSFSKFTEVESKIKAVLNTDLYLKETTLCQLKNSNQLIAFSTKKEDFFELGFDGRRVSINGKFSKENNFFMLDEAQQKNNSLISISGKVNKSLLSRFIKQQEKDKFKKMINLSLDSISKKWNGEIDVSLKSFISKNDTIITYKYDDDFNRVEETVVKKTVIPDLQIELGSPNNALFDYLHSKEAIKFLENDTILIVNPLFKTYAKKGMNGLFLYSKEIEALEKVEDHKFSLSFNVEEYKETEMKPSLVFDKYLDSIKYITVIVTSDTKVEIVIGLKNNSENFIYNLSKITKDILLKS